MPLTVKRRILSEYPYSWWRQDTAVNGNVSSDYGQGIITGRQITESEGHPWPKDRGVKDVGGPFDTLKLEHQASNPPESGSWNFVSPYTGTRTGVGSVLPMLDAGIPSEYLLLDGTDDQYRSFVSNASTDSALTGIGSKLIASSVPTSPVLDGSVAIAELFREGLPSMMGSQFLKGKSDFFRSLGGEYLNVEFGWKPLISDLKDAAKAVVDSEAILTNLAKHSGKKLHRYRMLPDEHSTSVFMDNAGGYTPVRGTNKTMYTATAKFKKTESFFRRTWFSGEFTYHYDPGQMTEIERISKEARLLLGLEITPEVLWNLAPWSWLIDWIANVGPVLSNMSAFQQDGLVMRYGYVMQTSRRTITYTNDPAAGHPELSYPRKQLVHRFQGTRKVRQQANPYGFGITFESLTSRQLRILVALGLSRS